MKEKRLGMGLEALIGPANGSDLRQVDVSLLKTNPFQPRTDFDDASINNLASSIKECGLLQPLVVRGRNGSYEIVTGERRWRAAMVAGLTNIPCIVKSATDEQMLQFALIENIQRSDLNPIEKARAFKQLIERFSYTHEKIGEIVGLDRSSVTNLLRLLELAEAIQEAIANGLIDSGHARALLAVKDAVSQSKLLEKIVRENLSVRDLERIIYKRKRATHQANSRYTQIEERLQEFFGTKVNVQSRKKGGTIMIDFYSDDQLSDILKRLKINCY